MLATLRKKLKWTSIYPSSENTINRKSLIMVVLLKLLEDALFWRSAWLSVTFIAAWHVVFMVCIHKQITLFQFILCVAITALLMDAFESWLKYKHRTSCLKRIAQSEPVEIIRAGNNFFKWLGRKWYDFVTVREMNHTKAFILANIILIMVLFFGKYIDSYVLIYLTCLFISTCYKILPPIIKMGSHIFQDIESESELEGLIPEASDTNIKLLSIEPEKPAKVDERQSLDYWQPEDVPIEEASDSSDNSSSITTNFSIEKVQSLQKDVETSDSSEDEYIPFDQQKEQSNTTVEIVEPATWSSSAYNTLWNITGAVANLMQSDKPTARKRIPSADSSDGFEMIDKNELN